MLRQPSAAPFIPAHLLSVLTTVEFDHEPGSRTAEVGDEFSNRKLPPEFGAVEARIAQT
jgi:hypothetical protein